MPQVADFVPQRVHERGVRRTFRGAGRPVALEFRTAPKGPTDFAERLPGRSHDE
ncbi:hypothetical protein [Streptacidiphilus monticola]|uniref:Uncharacterized protein n=1 Tax=Streptacidiphilus monticola TaxID=2161674 RepID=A0ABW1G7L6_9ACTN